MAIGTAKLSLEEFLLLPDRPGADLELSDGEIIEVPPPSKYHMQLQERLSLLLKTVLGSRYHVRFEFSYAVAGDAHRADVGAVSLAKWEQEDKKNLPPSPPELLIEILSPSNTTLALNRLRDLCFRNGCLQFWEVDPDLRIITIFAPDRDPHVYRSHSNVPLNAMTDGSEAVAVDEIFAD